MPSSRNWKKIADTTKLKQITDQKGMDDYSHIPTMKRNKLKMRRENREAVLKIAIKHRTEKKLYIWTLEYIYN